MSEFGLLAHLANGTTTACRAWIVSRRDGAVLGFTDHDRDLLVQGVTCRANTGMTARALQQTTGLSVDNSEAVGALSDAAVTEEDIIAGRYDGSEVRVFLVNWAEPTEQIELFRGSLGEIQRGGGGFRAELRGMSEILNQSQGRAYLTRCTAVLGDGRCRFNTLLPGYSVDRVIEATSQNRVFEFESFAGFDDRWFDGGRLEVLSGAAQGLVGLVKTDRLTGTARRIELWQAIMAPLTAGDTVRLIAGCDKSPAMCRGKFGNFLNFRGFPHIPGDDWLTSYPVADKPSTGGSWIVGELFG